MGKLHKSLGIKKDAALSYCNNEPESEAFLGTSKRAFYSLFIAV